MLSSIPSEILLEIFCCYFKSNNRKDILKFRFLNLRIYQLIYSFVKYLPEIKSKFQISYYDHKINRNSLYELKKFISTKHFNNEKRLISNLKCFTKCKLLVTSKFKGFSMRNVCLSLLKFKSNYENSGVCLNAEEIIINNSSIEHASLNGKLFTSKSSRFGTLHIYSRDYKLEKCEVIKGMHLTFFYDITLETLQNKFKSVLFNGYRNVFEDEIFESSLQDFTNNEQGFIKYERLDNYDCHTCFYSMYFADIKFSIWFIDPPSISNDFVFTEVK